MHRPRAAWRTLFPFALALGALGLGALALGCYVVGVHHVDACGLTNSAVLPFFVGGACVAAAVTLGFLAGYRWFRRKPGPLGWIAIVVVSLIAAVVTEFCALVLGFAPSFC